MTRPLEGIANSESTARPTVSIGGRALTPELTGRLLRVVVDNDLHLPGMVELTFLDLDGTTAALSGASIGAPVTVVGAGPGGVAMTLISGEITAIEGLVSGITVRTIFRGYTEAHRLQRAKRSRTFLNVTDADIARRVATEAGLSVGMIMPTSTTHAYMAQVNQTDWEFLTARATEIGFEVGVAGGLFHFRPATDSATAAGGGLEGFGKSLLADALDTSDSGVAISFPDTLISFRPRITAGNLTPDVELRVWDPMLRQTLSQAASTPTGGAPSPAGMGAQFTTGGVSAIGNSLEAAADSLTSFSLTGVQDGLRGAEQAATNLVSEATGGLLGSPIGFLGAPPSPTARVVVDRPAADSTTMPTTGPMVAGALGTDVGSTFAEAEGEAKGNAAIQPGAKVSITGVPGVFAGGWQISRAKHVYDDSEFGYRVVFSAHGRQDRTLLGLTSRTKRRGGTGVLDSVVCGVVSNCADPLGKGRVKVTLPWLSPDFETDWAPNAQFCSGPRSGAIFMPEVGDEVLVAFEFGDARRPYVIGAMMNSLTGWSIAASGPIVAGGLPGLGDMAAGMAGQAIGSAALSSYGPLGSMVGGQIGRQVANEAVDEAQEAIDGSVLAPGMLTEVHHRGYVSSTGNALLFYDVPNPLATPPQHLTQAMGDQGGGTDSGGGGVLPAGAGALGSAVRLGSQNGEMGVTVDQVNGGVTISATPVPGVTTIPLPNVAISAMNGFVSLSSGPSGTMLVDGGSNLVITAAQSITLQSTAINVMGAVLVNGKPLPL